MIKVNTCRECKKFDKCKEDNSFCSPNNFACKKFEVAKYFSNVTLSPDALSLYNLPKEKDIDWEQRRYEIARDYLVYNAMESSGFQEAISIAIGVADMLIKQLKGE